MQFSPGQKWYDLALNDSGVCELFIYDAIGAWGVSAKSLIEDMCSLKGVKEIVISINSPGGEVFDGLAIYNYLARRAEKKTIRIDGIAASVASVVAMAGDEIHMPSNAMMMVHNPWTYAMGDADELRGAAEMLDKCLASLTGIYARKSGQTPEKIVELLDAESYLSADECKALGLCTHVDEPRQMAARFDAGKYRLPMNLFTEPAANELSPEIAAEPVAPAIVEPAPEPAPVAEVTAPIDPRAEFKAFSEKFGNKAAAYFADGLTMEQASEKHAAELSAQNAALVAAAAQAKAAQFAPDDATAPANWPAALAACSGDYVAARSKFPAVYAEFMKGHAR